MKNVAVLNPVKGLERGAGYHHPESLDRTLTGKFERDQWLV